MFADTPADRARLAKKLAKLRHHGRPGSDWDLPFRFGYRPSRCRRVAHGGQSKRKAAHNLAKVLVKNSKTEAVDTHALAEYMPPGWILSLGLRPLLHR